MARAFTIHFPFNEKTYTAVVSQNDITTSIYLPDEELHTLIPAGKISFDVQQQFSPNTSQLRPAENLIVTILGAIEARDRDLQGLQERMTF